MKLSTKAPVIDSSGHHNHNHNHPRSAMGSVSSEHDDRDDQSPPMSPLRLPQLSSSSSSIASWASQGSQISSEDGDSQPASGCNSKEDRAAYNTKFARYHIETYRQNDRMRWNFDFDHNRPLDDNHHHHHHAVARYQWEPAI